MSKPILKCPPVSEWDTLVINGVPLPSPNCAPVALTGDSAEIHRQYGYGLTADWIKTVASECCRPDVAYMMRMKDGEVRDAVKMVNATGPNAAPCADLSALKSDP